jgi:HlyD family secretion protein
MKFNRTQIVAVAVVAAMAAGGWAWYASRNGAGDAKYRIGKVERGPIRAVVVASGTLNAVTSVQVGSQVSGQILEIFADFNTQVKKDQIIARIDPQTFELRSTSRAPTSMRPRAPSRLRPPHSRCKGPKWAASR